MSATVETTKPMNLVAPFARWAALRAQYGGQDEVEVENGMLAPPVRPPAWRTSWR
jgi:hypothetical protein